jgi:sensor c-di-GMP phosphodiesterase-like protein
MRRKALYALVWLTALAAAVLLPWLAFRESQAQAYESGSELGLAYARDVLHRTDELARQADAGILRLQHSGHAPCSAEAHALMREIHLTSTYIQGIGYAQDGVMLCSSFGDTPMPLGTQPFRISDGARLYLGVPVGDQPSSPLMAIERGHFVVLVHRDLPLDTWSALPGVSIGVQHLERPRDASPTVARGYMARDWLAHLGTQRETTFIDGSYLVTIARSTQFATAAIVAIPVSYHQKRAMAIAERLVPAGAILGLLLAAAVLLLGRQQMSLATALRHALRRNAFFLDYQPLVDLRTGRHAGAEALLRMRSSAGADQIGPDLFIPVAEQNRLITRLTERVLHLVEQDAGSFLARHPDFHIALNVSGADLRSDALLSLIDGFLQRTGARPSNLIIEITERGFIDPETARGTIAGLRARGIKVAIDDFGTGYSSLSHLESLHLDLLKIDRSFIETIGTTASTSQVVSHIIAMAQTIGLHMVAEGIETEDQAAFVRRHGVEFAQGWLFGRPMPFGALERMMAAQPQGEFRH